MGVGAMATEVAVKVSFIKNYRKGGILVNNNCGDITDDGNGLNGLGPRR